MGESPTKRAFTQYISKTSVPNNEGHVDSIRLMALTSHIHINIF